MNFNEYLIENLNTDFPPLYHGTSSDDLIKTLYFKTKDVYLTEEYDEAVGFADNKHLGGSYGKNKFVMTIMAKKGKIFNGSEDVDKIITEEHDKFNDLDELMDWARNEKYAYVTFQHPSFDNNKDHNVIVSLNPNKDLKVVDVDELNKEI